MFGDAAILEHGRELLGLTVPIETIEEAGKALDNVSAQVDQLPAEGRKLLASAVASVLPSLKTGAEKVASLSPEMKPTLDAIIARLEGWANAPA